MSHVALWVRDQDEALEFYTRTVGFEVRADATIAEFGGLRWVTVGPASQPDLEIMLSVPAPPIMEPARPGGSSTWWRMAGAAP